MIWEEAPKEVADRLAQKELLAGHVRCLYGDGPWRVP